MTYFKVKWEDTTNRTDRRTANVVIEDGYTTFEDIRKIIAVKYAGNDINRVDVFSVEKMGDADAR